MRAEKRLHNRVERPEGLLVKGRSTKQMVPCLPGVKRGTATADQVESHLELERQYRVLDPTDAKRAKPGATRSRQEHARTLEASSGESMSSRTQAPQRGSLADQKRPSPRGALASHKQPALPSTSRSSIKGACAKNDGRSVAHSSRSSGNRRRGLSQFEIQQNTAFREQGLQRVDSAPEQSNLRRMSTTLRQDPHVGPENLVRARMLSVGEHGEDVAGESSKTDEAGPSPTRGAESRSVRSESENLRILKRDSTLVRDPAALAVGADGRVSFDLAELLADSDEEEDKEEDSWRNEVEEEAGLRAATPGTPGRRRGLSQFEIQQNTAFREQGLQRGDSAPEQSNLRRMSTTLRQDPHVGPENLAARMLARLGVRESEDHREFYAGREDPAALAVGTPGAAGPVAGFEIQQEHGVSESGDPEKGLRWCGTRLPWLSSADGRVSFDLAELLADSDEEEDKREDSWRSRNWRWTQGACNPRHTREAAGPVAVRIQQNTAFREQGLQRVTQLPNRAIRRLCPQALRQDPHVGPENLVRAQMLSVGEHGEGVAGESSKTDEDRPSPTRGAESRSVRSESENLRILKRDSTLVRDPAALAVGADGRVSFDLAELLADSDEEEDKEEDSWRNEVEEESGLRAATPGTPGRRRGLSQFEIQQNTAFREQGLQRGDSAPEQSNLRRMSTTLRQDPHVGPENLVRAQMLSVGEHGEGVAGESSKTDEDRPSPTRGAESRSVRSESENLQILKRVSMFLDALAVGADGRVSFNLAELLADSDNTEQEHESGKDEDEVQQQALSPKRGAESCSVGLESENLRVLKRVSMLVQQNYYRVFYIWVQLVADRQDRQSAAAEHWRRWSLGAILQSWKMELSRSKIKEARQLALLVFFHWREQILTLQQVQQMCDRGCRRLLEQAWMAYRDHLAWGRWVAEVLRGAAMRSYFRSQCTIFSAWSNFLAANRWRKNLCRDAIAAFRYGILCSATGQDLVQIERMDTEARELCKMSLLRRVLCEWLAVIPTMHLRAPMVPATQRPTMAVQGRVLQLWCKRIQQLAAWKHLRGAALSRGWRSWRTYVFKCRRLVSLSMQVVCMWITGITGRALNNGNTSTTAAQSPYARDRDSFTEPFSQCRLMVDEVMRQLHMRQMVHRWMRAVVYLQNLKYKKQLAESHARRRVLSTAMRQMCCERVWNHQKLAMAKDHAYVHRLSRLFTGWICATSQCLHRRETLFKQVAPHVRATLRRMSSVQERGVTIATR
ncbi:hypothetical protein CYMTET_37690 [Cymbomonas tetramitiformis]|uniref:Sfi1 spindle body domain-containing protein n=1 Tax=Cymbomonas tetramitiformis TaxID=36881 RepID=A0AAE0CEY1_9CHLO|nr:hypothetical protein CYMTET_37690 [Cymbomonas tetramitiformis]